MHCPKCNVDRPVKDFLGKEFCFKCVYKEKALIAAEIKKKTPEKRNCKICDDVLKDNRWAYCSNECADKGNQIHMDGHWTRQIICDKNHWRNNPL